MAKITITLRDEADGRVSVKTDCIPPPSLRQDAASAPDLDAVATPAQCEAIALLQWLGERAAEFGEARDEARGTDA